MSRFDELCNTFAEGRNNWFAYRDRCQSFAGRLLGSFLRYLDAPKEAYTWARMSAEEIPQPAPFFEAIRLEPDGYWHARGLLTVYEAPNVYPYQPLFLEILFRSAGEAFFVRISPEADELEIRENEQKCLDKFNETLFKVIEDFFKESTDWESKSPQPDKAPARKIGFRIEGR